MHETAGNQTAWDTQPRWNFSFAETHPRFPVPFENSPYRQLPRCGVPSRQRTANKQAEGLTAVPAIRPLTCTSW